MLCETAASVTSEKIHNRDQFDQTHWNQWWLSIPKTALLTKSRSPSVCETGFNILLGPGWVSQHSWMCTSGTFSSFLAFGGNVWWPLLWWPLYETWVKSQHSSVRVAPLGSNPEDMRRLGPPCVEFHGLLLLKITPKGLMVQKNPSKSSSISTLSVNIVVWLGIVLVAWGRFNSSTLN